MEWPVRLLACLVGILPMGGGITAAVILKGFCVRPGHSSPQRYKARTLVPILRRPMEVSGGEPRAWFGAQRNLLVRNRCRETNQKARQITAVAQARGVQGKAWEEMGCCHGSRRKWERFRGQDAASAPGGYTGQQPTLPSPASLVTLPSALLEQFNINDYMSSQLPRTPRHDTALGAKTTAKFPNFRKLTSYCGELNKHINKIIFDSEVQAVKEMDRATQQSPGEGGGCWADLSEEKKSSPGLASSRQLPMLSGQFLHDIKQNYRELATGHLGLPTTEWRGDGSSTGEELVIDQEAARHPSPKQHFLGPEALRGYAVSRASTVAKSEGAREEARSLTISDNQVPVSNKIEGIKHKRLHQL
ncbi:hypothetical protein PANDA_006566 [Ailuropoda melanoleuca]|uniref:Uncharacterized protein n=1 Tax=Ailuropoda melanoleuca TaxID=9646 RepID=D2H8J5_AILME|nr:hypothetical protein PANDA_006566 [Ailuropoda melanoleuca]